MRLRFRKPFVLGLICALDVFGSTPAQKQSAGMTLKAHVSPAFSLSISGRESSSRFEITVEPASALRATVERVGLNETIITLTGTGQTAASRVMVPFEIRTNAPYEMRIERLSAEGCELRLAASVDSIRPGGVGVALQAAGDSMRRKPVDISNLNTAAAILSGSRVSIAGGLTSPTNALLVNLAFDVDGQSRECDWQAAFRISLNQPSR